MYTAHHHLLGLSLYQCIATHLHLVYLVEECHQLFCVFMKLLYLTGVAGNILMQEIQLLLKLINPEKSKGKD